MKRAFVLGAALFSLTAPAAHGQDPHGHGATLPARDDRVVLALSPAERAMILEEMHRFLAGVQKMTGALGREDMVAAAQAARALGVSMTHDVPAALRAKLPLEFRQLGASVHREFDQIALDAESLADARHSLGQLSSTLEKCVSCHASYQIRTPAPDARR